MKYFLLDKEFAIQNQARCIGISDKPFTQEEIKKAKLIYKTKETIIFQGNDIPVHMQYNSINDTIVEKAEVNIISRAMKNIIENEISIFDEDIPVENNVFYFYLDKIQADTNGLSTILATFPQPLLDPDTYLGKPNYMFKGKDVPYYITVDNVLIREATNYEKYTRGQYELQDGEIVENNQIKVIPIPDSLFKPKWESPRWVESATIQEKEDIHNQLINQLKDEILTIGFEYIQKNKTKHQQKTRDKDRSFLDSSISSMKRQSIPIIFWSFNDEDIVELTLQELEDLQDDGFEFNQAVFKVEAELKAQAPTKNVTIDTYRQKVNAISSIKCFEK